jgi:MFS family permease
MAQAFDYLPKEKYVAAAGGLLLAYSVGATGGPLLLSFLMEYLGVSAFFGFIAAVSSGLSLFVIHRMRARTAKPVAEQEPVVAMPLRLSPVVSELDPRLDEEETGQAPKDSGEAA